LPAGLPPSPDVTPDPDDDRARRDGGRGGRDRYEACRHAPCLPQDEYGVKRPDLAPEPQDWYWLLGWLAGKAVHAATTGDVEKARHHTISSAAVLLNWHRHLSMDDDQALE
jgi:hypothetical protein